MMIFKKFPNESPGSNYSQLLKCHAKTRMSARNLPAIYTQHTHREPLLLFSFHNLLSSTTHTRSPTQL